MQFHGPRTSKAAVIGRFNPIGSFHALVSQNIRDPNGEYPEDCGAD